MIDSWKDTIKNKDLTLKIEWYNPAEGKKELEIADIVVRTNFDFFTRQRRPSIITIADHHGRTFYLRLLEDHSKTTSLFNDFRDFGARTTNDPATLLHLPYKKVVDPFWNRRLLKHEIRPLGEQRDFKQPYIYIPETHLFYVLEGLYQEGVPRLTPRVRVVEARLDYLCVIRPSLSLLVDTGVDEERMRHLGRYFGILHTLGLSDIYDRQLEHYAIQPSHAEHEEPTVINYDPDFMVLDRRKPKSRISPLSIDVSEFKQEFGRKHLVVSRREWGQFFRARREALEDLTQQFGKEGIDQALYKRLKPSLFEYERSSIE